MSHVISSPRVIKNGAIVELDGFDKKYFGDLIQTPSGDFLMIGSFVKWNPAIHGPCCGRAINFFQMNGKSLTIFGAMDFSPSIHLQEYTKDSAIFLSGRTMI